LVSDGPVDLVLSSGFLAFARQLGFLQAVEEAGLEVGAVCGTSSGALVGALWYGGMSLEAITEELTSRPPSNMLQGHWRIWRGLFLFDRALARLRELLPPGFDDLPGPFGAGVRGPDGRHALLTSGSLPEAVAASCAMPVVFAPVEVDGVRYQDGGAVDRLGIDRWRALRGDVPTVIHWVDRTAGKEDDVEVGDAVVAQTPRSGANFWNLGDVPGQMEEARRMTAAALGLP
jgi:predicted acylesterase/phospholipase RssA